MDIAIRQASPDEIDLAIAIDDDACTLYDTVGLHFDIRPDHPFAQSEHGRWLEAMQAGRAYFAVASGVVGLLVVSMVGCVRQVEQLSVRRRSMQTGVGRIRASRRAAGATTSATS